jgi:hypothetical protein
MDIMLKAVAMIFVNMITIRTSKPCRMLDTLSVIAPATTSASGGEGGETSA